MSTSVFSYEGFCTMNHSILHSGRGQRFDNGWMWFVGFASFLLLFLFLRFPRSVEPPNFRAAQRFRKLVNLGNGLKSLSRCAQCFVCSQKKKNQTNYLFSFFIFGLRMCFTLSFFFLLMKLNFDWNFDFDFDLKFCMQCIA